MCVEALRGEAEMERSEGQSEGDGRAADSRGTSDMHILRVLYDPGFYYTLSLSVCLVC